MGNGTVLQIRPAGEKMWCLRDLLSAIPIFFFFFCIFSSVFFFLSTLPPKMNCSMLFQVSLGNCSAPVCKNGCPFPLILHSRAIYGYFLSLFLSSLARLQWGTIMSCSLHKKKKNKNDVGCRMRGKARIGPWSQRCRFSSSPTSAAPLCFTGWN